MSEIVSLLEKEYFINSRLTPRHKTAKSPGCVVIVETRDHPLFLPVIWNVMSKLSDWDLHVFCGETNGHLTSQIPPQWGAKITALPYDELPTEEYSKILKSKAFWDKIDHENILIIQTDCCIFNGFDIDSFTKHSYIGPPYYWGTTNETGGIEKDLLSPKENGTNICGGLSFRKKSAMLRCIEEVSEDRIELWRIGKDKPPIKELFNGHIPEDTYFHHALFILEEPLPEDKELGIFCAAINKTPEADAIHSYEKWCSKDEQAAYCSRHQSFKPKLLIYNGYTHTEFNGEDYSGKHGIRGSEIGLINIAENLTATYDVYVVGHNISKNIYKNVNYFNVNELQNFLNNNSLDTLIVNRYINFFVDFKNTAKNTYIWVQDCGLIGWWNGTELTKAGKYMLHNLLPGIDGIICLSNAHIKTFTENYDVPRDKIFTIGNGINIAPFEKEVEKIKDSFIFMATPERGLLPLLDSFSYIKESVPSATLDVYSDLDSTLFNMSIDDAQNKMENMPGVTSHGHIQYEDLLERLKETEIWLYPATWYETYCTSALEAQAAGCLTVTRNYGAVPEVIGNRGLLFNGDIGENQSLRETVCSEIVGLLQEENREVKEELQQKGRSWALDQSWAQRSIEWTNCLTSSNVSVIILYCSQDEPYLLASVEQCSTFSNDIIIVQASTLLGETELDDYSLPESLVDFNVKHVIIDIDHSKQNFPEGINKYRYWKNILRHTGYTKAKNDWLLVLDGDEVPDGERLKRVPFFNLDKGRSYGLRAHYYFRSPTMAATTLNECAGWLYHKHRLGHMGMAIKDGFMNNRERSGLDPQGFSILNDMGIPFVHHYSWCGSKDKLLEKVRYWGHKEEKNWPELIERSFTEPFEEGSKCFVHGYTYHEVPNFLSI
jgi:glycosyltransferase involved in cell wall biosynthesis